MKTEEILKILYNLAVEVGTYKILEFCDKIEEFFIENNITFIKDINYVEESFL
jgi:hypothetical protein